MQLERLHAVLGLGIKKEPQCFSEQGWKGKGWIVEGVAMGLPESTVLVEVEQTILRVFFLSLHAKGWSLEATTTEPARYTVYRIPDIVYPELLMTCFFPQS